jgi:hypothetical protein
MARKSKAAQEIPPKVPKQEPLWKVYVKGELRRIYTIEVDESGKRVPILQVWLGDV